MQQKNGRVRTKHLRFVSLVIALACLAAAYYSIRMAYAEYLFRTDRPEALERASELIPLAADYQARLNRLELAVKLNPYFSAAWIELGIRAEAAGDLTKAERALLEAVRVDRTFEPRWTLANFYFRRKNWGEFWRWIRAAAEMSHGNRTALFQLCWRATSDPDLVLERALPSDRAILGDYVEYLATSERYAAAQTAADRWIPLAAKDDVSRLLELCDVLIEKAHNGPAARRIWNDLIERGWLSYGGDSLVTNARFQTQPIGHGFDWRILEVPGVRASWLRPKLTLSFDGYEPEQADLLVQWMTLSPSSAYELSISSESPDILRDSGLRCRVVDAGSAAVLTESALNQSSRFNTLPHTALVEVVIGYRRAPGTNRISGKLLLWSVGLRPLSR